jgi:hypothetical protein
MLMKPINPSAFSGQQPQQPPPQANNQSMDMNMYLLQKTAEIKRRMFGDQGVGALQNFLMQQRRA